MFGIHTLSGKDYAPLNNDENLDEKVPKSFNGVSAGLFKWFVLVLALSGVGSLGFLAGRRSINEQRDLQCEYLKSKKSIQEPFR